jgi:superfamily II DNA/RNA helicase
VADTVVNFEPPWNPAKKNQRIGRIDRLGQRSKNLTVINFITRNSIETSVASGLALKQNLFESVLNEDNNLDSLDFSASGKAQFLQELENVMDGFVNAIAPENETEKQLETADDSALQEIVSEELVAEIPIEEKKKIAQQAESMEKVMNQGMEFLAGLFKITTGKDIGIQNQKIEIDKQTGEVVMRFKLPTLE